jgi:large conductance mechanosensitive channel
MFNQTIKEFKNFAIKGNVVDLALAVVIGGAFGKIVSSLVNDMVMPSFGYIIGGVKFSNLKWILKKASEDSDLISINYGNFIQSIVDFLIIALSIFVIIKIYNKFKRVREERDKQEKQVIKTNPQEELLKEIRDILKNKS